jgi:hypothetical protein
MHSDGSYILWARIESKMCCFFFVAKSHVLRIKSHFHKISAKNTKLTKFFVPILLCANETVKFIKFRVFLNFLLVGGRILMRTNNYG